MPKRFHINYIVYVMLAVIPAILYLLWVPRFPQWQSYHKFSDSRVFWMIPNFADVISNGLFLSFGIYGLILLVKNKNSLTNKPDTFVYSLLFIAIILTGIGSTYYHLSPNNATLVWDRIPMTVIFMTLLSLTIMQRIHPKLGLYLLLPFIVLGVFSVVYWYATELAGVGDLRPYALVQFYAMFIIVAILVLFRKPYPPTTAYLYVGFFYILAKLAEYYDRFIFDHFKLLSGHTIKHVAAAIGCYGFVMMVKAQIKRRANENSFE
ncbi:ceramidase domain-containing protein [Legionella sp. W05-934-2]|jgi:hypothetical protein|uniref:ceramidase domain-containing protein n=1 Tax=Legionella sp. W05-934-2 TaxID=1198649 RepID=UPI003462E0E8